MRAGRLRHRVTIERPTPVQDATGQMVDQWTFAASRRAAVEPLTGREAFASDTIIGTATARIILRYGLDIASIEPTWRIVHGATVYEIESVINPGNRNRELICLVRSKGYDNLVE